MIALLLSLAWAQEPTPDAPQEAELQTLEAGEAMTAPAEEPPDAPAETEEAEAPKAEESPLEITVWGDLAVQKAKDAIVRDLEAQGYERHRSKDGVIVFKPPRAWMGRAQLSDDGSLSFLRPILAVQGAQLDDLNLEIGDEQNPNLSRQPGGSRLPADVNDSTTGREVFTAPVPQGSFWVLPSKALLDRVQGLVMVEVAEEVREYRNIREETRIQLGVQELPERLDALWQLGEPLSGSSTLEDVQARKEAILAYWSSRSADREGDLQSKAIERWLRNVVMESDRPVTPEEKATAEAGRSDGRTLQLD